MGLKEFFALVFVIGMAMAERPPGQGGSSYPGGIGGTGTGSGGFVSGVPVQCYVGIGENSQTITSCPGWSRGCIKRTYTLKSGYEQEHRLCADEERSDLVYNEGCDSIDVPYEKTECYCKGNLCNASPRMLFNALLTVFALVSVLYSI